MSNAQPQPSVPSKRACSELQLIDPNDDGVGPKNEGEAFSPTRKRARGDSEAMEGKGVTSFRDWIDVRPNSEIFSKDLEADPEVQKYLSQKQNPTVVINLVAAISVMIAGQFEDEELQIDVSQRAQRLLVNDNSAIHALVSGRGSLSDVARTLLDKLDADYASGTPVSTAESIFTPSPDNAGKSAATAAWLHPYQGDYATLLRKTISDYMTDDNVVARFTTFVQSSGMGKSRMVDEMARKVIVLPVCLSEADSYPPQDGSVVEFFNRYKTNQEKIYMRAQAYLTALFTEFSLAVEGIIEVISQDGNTTAMQRFETLAGRFRGLMTDNMTFESHNVYRTSFYERVTSTASELYNKYSPPGEQKAEARSELLFHFKDGQDMIKAAKRLESILRNYVNRAVNFPLPNGCFVTLAFDESHHLASPQAGKSWSVLSELRRALRLIVPYPIFTIFLSTSGKLRLLSPDLSIDPSSRFSYQKLSLHPPLFQCPFDLVPEEHKFSTEPIWTLARVASTEHMAYLGRPLFSAMYQAGDSEFRSKIVMFAICKLLCAGTTKITDKVEEQTLACLSVRLGLEFKTPAWLEGRLDIECRQVERHMRVCLAATPGLQKIVTICPSEPLLAEAAYRVMRASTHVKWISKFVGHVNSFYVDVGKKGEVVAGLIILMAYDKARGSLQSLGNNDLLTEDGKVSGRVISVLDFLSALIGSDGWRGSLPFRIRTPEDNIEMEQAFRGCYMYFNHFIKIEDFDILNRAYLLLAISRGAAIICADCQCGIDIVLPFLVGDKLTWDAVGAIIIKVKNDRRYAEDPDNSLFDDMDPFANDIAIFSEDTQESIPPPLIRCVFSFASKDSQVVIRQPPSPHSKHEQAEHKFTAYDILLAGAKHNTFPAIAVEDEEYFEQILQVARGRTLLKEGTQSQRQMAPLRATHYDRLHNWVKD